MQRRLDSYNQTAMKATILTTAMAAGIMLAACGGKTDKGDSPATDVYALKAYETLDSIYSHYGIDSVALLRENYPFNEEFKATYLAYDQQADQPNPYSYLWPFSGTLSAVTALYEATGDSACLEILNRKVLPGLEHYADTTRTPFAYASYVNTAAPSDRFYDDNIWLGIDFTDLYLTTGRKPFLEKAAAIWKFIESGTDSELGGGIYWCEQKKRSKNACSNTPGAVYALKLFQATADSSYLEKGRNLYQWTKSCLQDTTDCLIFDNIGLSGKVDSTKYAYNSGQMLQAAALLCKITGDSVYLDDARKIARSAYERFFNGGEATDQEGSFRLIGKGNVWFTAVMMRGFAELYRLDGQDTYMEAFRRNLDHAWLNSRDNSTGLFSTDWSGKVNDKEKWLLTQAAMGEMYARLASYNNK